MDLGQIAQFTAAVASLTAAVSSFRNSRKIDVIRKATDGLAANLVATTAVAAKAEGKAEGLEQGRNGK